MRLAALNYLLIIVAVTTKITFAYLYDANNNPVYLLSERVDPNSVYSAIIDNDAHQGSWSPDVGKSRSSELCDSDVFDQFTLNYPYESENNGFRLIINGDPAFFTPGKTYHLMLQYNRFLTDAVNSPRYDRFLLSATPLRRKEQQAADVDAVLQESLPAVNNNAQQPPIEGRFLPLENDSPIQTWRNCRNIITSDIPANMFINEMHVSWTAPSTQLGNSMCVRFSAAMLGAHTTAYSSNGNERLLYHDFCPHNNNAWKAQNMPAVAQFEKRLRKQQRAVADTVVATNTSSRCPCDTAKYRVFFDGLWSKLTHPYSFPAEENFVHFSNIIGASHSDKYRLWEMGGSATSGMRKLAMYGITDGVQQELKARPSRDVQTIIEMDGLWFPETHSSSRNAIFRADQTRHFVSLASMVGPSPDWLVGVDSFDMCDERTGQWIQTGPVMLYPFDAGVDRGETFLSRDEPFNEPIHNITGPPFYRRDAQSGQEMPTPPLARVRFQLIRIYPRTCSDSAGSGRGGTNAVEDRNATLVDGEGISEENLRDMKSSELPVCRVSDWSPWSACAAECPSAGNSSTVQGGTQTRTRQYLNPWKAKVQACERILTETQQTCRPSKQEMMQCQQQQTLLKNMTAGPAAASNAAMMPKATQTAGSALNCMTSPWSVWSNCTATCGTGTMQRTRMLKIPHATPEETKKCQQMVSLVERTNCYGTDCSDENDMIDENLLCKVTPWSTWSACSVLCGIGGIQYRSRQFRNRHLAPPNMRSESALSKFCNTTLTFELRNCRNENKTLCDMIASGETQQDCLLERRRGPCRGYFPRYYYDAQRRACLNFIYGGCKGNTNNFRTFNECQRKCENVGENKTVAFPDQNQILNDVTSDPNAIDFPTSKAMTTKMMKFGAGTSPEASRLAADDDAQTVNKKTCVVSDWSDWSSCSAKCGRGSQFRTRSIIRKNMPDEKCDEELKQVRSCRLVQCPVDCKMSSSFGEWSECSRSCGRGIQERVQMIEIYPRRGGRPCSLPKSEIRLCKQLPPCKTT